MAGTDGRATGCGGGGGWFGGGGGAAMGFNGCHAGGGGGSSFAFGPDATPPADYKLVDELRLVKAGVLGGKDKFLSPAGVLATGNTGNGHVRITIVE